MTPDVDEVEGKLEEGEGEPTDDEAREPGRKPQSMWSGVKERLQEARDEFKEEYNKES